MIRSKNKMKISGLTNQCGFVFLRMSFYQADLFLLRWEGLWVGRGIGQRSTGRSEEGRVYREEGRGSHGRWTRGVSGRELEKTS